ncbi:MAG: HAD-IIB family hydrolase [Coriobacteriia bacterium]|nr:HAD-IIB family hydrolase [Coriobacteriia bacterium]
MAEPSAEPVIAFFDVDGTLTYRDPVTGPTDVPTARVREAICRFVEAGNVAVVCTGRSVLGIQNLMASCPFAGAVTLDGTHVVCGGKVVYDRVIAPDVFAETVAEMRRIGMEALVEGTSGCATVLSEANPNPEFRRVMSHMETLEAYAARGGRMEFGKIDFTDESLAACRASEYLMATYDYLNVGDGYHELAIPGTSKGVGARAFIDALPFSPSRFFAFGDSENDLAILDAADVAVVMGNASDRVKEHADFIADHVAQDGVATALESLGLI